MGYPEVRKIDIPRRGPFWFSRKYDEGHIETVLQETRTLYNFLIEIPILPNVYDQLEKDIIRRSIHSTAAIEGNPSSEEEVGRILGKSGTEIYTKQQEIEIRNLKEAYNIVKEVEFDSDKHLMLKEKLIDSIHGVVMLDLQKTGESAYRSEGETYKVGDKDHGGTYQPPRRLKDIRNLMKEYIEYVNSNEMLSVDPLIRASLAHFHLGLIHPFADGNGRTARLVEAFLIRSGNTIFFPTALSNYYYRHMDEYYNVFSEARKNKAHDVTIFVEFVIKGAIDVLEEIKSNVVLFIRRLTLAEFYTQMRQRKGITQRQYDLMGMLLSNPRKFSLSDLKNEKPFDVLYRDVTDRTMRRDVGALLSKKLIQKEDGATYVLNLNVLDLARYQEILK